MPYEMAYTSNTGTSFTNSFWFLSCVSLNHIAGTGVLHFNGYATLAHYYTGAGPIAIESFVVSDPGFYQASIRYQLEDPNAQFSAYAYLESAAAELSSFFDAATFWSIIQPIYPENVSIFGHTLEVGEQGQSRVAVVFSGPGVSHNSAGVTIKINGVAATITASSNDAGYFSFRTRNFYDISPAAQPGDVVTWEYDAASGVLIDPSETPLLSSPVLQVTNTVGEYLKFNEPPNSAFVVLLFV